MEEEKWQRQRTQWTEKLQHHQQQKKEAGAENLPAWNWNGLKDSDIY